MLAPASKWTLVWLLLVPSLACRPGGSEDEVGATESTSESSSASSSESSESASDTSGTLENTCVSAADCALNEDCCNCVALPLGQEPPTCDLPECAATPCVGDFGLFDPQPICSVGTCQLAPLSCDLNDVLCDAAEPPPCEGGLVRAVVQDCYGACVPPSLCATLPFECDASTCGEGWACMTTQSGAPSKCVPLPAACDGVASCACVGPWLDEICVASCGESAGTLICQDGG